MSHNVNISVNKNDMLQVGDYTQTNNSYAGKRAILVSKNGYDVVQIGDSTNILVNASGESLGISSDNHFGVRIYPLVCIRSEYANIDPTQSLSIIGIKYNESPLTLGTVNYVVNGYANYGFTYGSGIGTTNTTGFQSVFNAIAKYLPPKPNIILPVGSIDSPLTTRASYYGYMASSTTDTANSVIGLSTLDFDSNNNIFNFSIQFKIPKTYISMPPLYQPIISACCYNRSAGTLEGGIVVYPMIYNEQGQPI